MSTTVKTAKKAAWAQYSIYIRTRDCIRFTGDPEQGMCVSCGRPYPFKKLQAGHFIGGRTNAVLFDERITYSQCYGCNVGKSGNYLEYYYFMEKEIGREGIDLLVAELKQTKIKYVLQDYIDLRQLYKERTKNLIATIQSGIKPAVDTSVFNV